VDSGATVHCLWDATCTAYLIEQNWSIGWGGVNSRAVCMATGHLCGVTFCKSKSNSQKFWLPHAIMTFGWFQPQRECSSHRFALRSRDTDVFYHLQFWWFYSFRDRGGNAILHVSHVPSSNVFR
jgi:hypothetical protein